MDYSMLLIVEINPEYSKMKSQKKIGKSSDINQSEKSLLLSSESKPAL